MTRSERNPVGVEAPYFARTLGEEDEDVRARAEDRVRADALQEELQLRAADVHLLARRVITLAITLRKRRNLREDGGQASAREDRSMAGAANARNTGGGVKARTTTPGFFFFSVSRSHWKSENLRLTRKTAMRPCVQDTADQLVRYAEHKTLCAGATRSPPTRLRVARTSCDP